MAHVHHLYHLQQIDSETAHATARIREIEQFLQHDQTVRKAKARALKAKQAAQEAEKALRKAEAEVSAQTSKLEHNQAALYGGRIHNPKELQDLQHEAEAIKRRIARLEEAQLEAMQNLEKARLRYKKAVRLYRAAQARQSEEHAALLGEKETLEQKLHTLQEERQSLVDQIPPDEYQLYEELRARRGGIAVAGVQAQTCGACGTTLNSLVLQAVRSPSRMARCPGCNRLLYLEP
ncbi:MAG: hypothetical protein D6755_14305 [Anaerolineae bacterium]|nr:MAG: hypothetical protein D6755_14305 [Anaerolineae bacterium]